MENNPQTYCISSIHSSPLDLYKLQLHPCLKQIILMKHGRSQTEVKPLKLFQGRYVLCKLWYSLAFFFQRGFSTLRKAVGFTGTTFTYYTLF